MSVTWILLVAGTLAGTYDTQKACEADRWVYVVSAASGHFMKPAQIVCEPQKARSG
jgi:hypothetical protein